MDTGMMQARYKRAVVKVGSNVLTKGDGSLDLEAMQRIVDQIAGLMRLGMEVILVSSGAVASGKSVISGHRRLDAVSARQLYSSVGQARLINSYCELFSRHGIICGQVLTTKESLSTRDHYLNQMNCMDTMLGNGVIPVVNENDTISVTELMFTDNDELSGMVASMMDAGCLVILSNVDGIYDGPPGNPSSEIIPEVRPGENISGCIASGKSSFGRGGMLTKYRIATKVADEGIEVVIANGRQEGILYGVLTDREGPVRCTRFLPSERPISHIKKWIAHSDGFAKGEIRINEGAYRALTGTRASSLLPVGVTSVSGEFEKGDIVKIIAPDGHTAGVGKVSAGSAKAAESIGQKGRKPLIHYDYLYIEFTESPEDIQGAR